jgi:hypothetical protein
MAKPFSAATSYEAEAAECEATAKAKREEAEALLSEAFKLEAQAKFCRHLASAMRRQEVDQRKPLPATLLRLVKTES